MGYEYLLPESSVGTLERPPKAGPGTIGVILRYRGRVAETKFRTNSVSAAIYQARTTFPGCEIVSYRRWMHRAACGVPGFHKS